MTLPLAFRIRILTAVRVAAFLLCTASLAAAQQARLSGTARDETGATLPGVLVELRSGTAAVQHTHSDERGQYRFDAIAPGRAELSFTLVNFATVRRSIAVGADTLTVDVVMHLVLSADVTVTGKSTFTNLADAPAPEQDLVGIAQSASQGAVTARQLETRPIMRPGDVLETVPGVVISQHSGEGKANQYYLRGFNLDHGTDFATTVAGMPVNMPTHGHGHGYSDLNFLIPELASGVQFSKGPYFAEHGDFATAGTANINYTNTLARPIVRVGGGGDSFGRVLLAAAPALRTGTLLGAIELEHSDGPWEQPDDLNKVNGIVRFSRGDTRNGLSATLMGYHATWNSTDQIPERAIDDGRIGRFGLVDATDGGESSRYSASVEWQRANANSSTRLTAYGLKYDLDLFSNFTYFLDDPVNGDQFQQTDHRFVTGSRLTHRRIGRWAGRPTENTVGVQFRNDAISDIGLYHTRQRQQLETIRHDSVRQTSAGTFAQNQTEWTPWLRTLAGVRFDGYRFGVDSAIPRKRRHRLRRRGQPEGRRRLRAVRENGDLRQRRPGLPQQRRARRHDCCRSRDGRAGTARHAARARDGRRDRLAHGPHPPPPDDGHGVDTRPRLRARLRRRRRDDGCGAAEPAAGHRVDHLLQAEAVVRARRRRRALARTVHR